MWPWEHLAIGYLVYSLGSRALGRPPPTDAAVLVLAVATQMPDLVDKPLSWGLGWFPSGYAIGHSAFVAVPVGLAALFVGQWRDRVRWSVPFVVGYWSHLLADVATPLRYGDRLRPGRVLWPVSEQAPYETDYGLDRGLVYLEDFLASLSTIPTTELLLLYLLLPAATVGLWVLDGAPGLTLAGRAVDAVRRLLK